MLIVMMRMRKGKGEKGFGNVDCNDAEGEGEKGLGEGGEGGGNTLTNGGIEVYVSTWNDKKAKVSRARLDWIGLVWFKAGDTTGCA